MEHIKKISSLILIFSFLLAGDMVVFAQTSDFCVSVESIVCDNLEGLNELSSQADKIKKDCGDNAFLSFQEKINYCNNELEKQKQDTEEELENIKNQENSAEKTLAKINLDIKTISTEIANSNLTISQLENEIKEKENNIIELEKTLGNQREILAETIKQIYEYDSTSFFGIILVYGSLSELGDKIEEAANLQISLKSSMKEIKNAQEKLGDEKTILENNREEKIKYNNSQEISRQSLSARKKQQNYLLEKLAVAKTPLEKEMARIETELIDLRDVMSRIQKYLSHWIINGEITWSSIFSAVDRSEKISGVMPALLLGILQIESTFGTGLGTPGKYKEYCNWSSLGKGKKTEAQALEEITSILGYEPNSVPMSKACAIGPSQFLPNTWQSYQRLYSGLNNPWNLNDAVLATGYYLARNGATSGNEKGAVYAYNHSNTYVSNVLNSAAAWQEVIDICGLNLSCPDMQRKLESIGNIPTR